MSRFATSLIAASLIAFSPLHAQDQEVTLAQYLEAWDAIDVAAIQKEIEETGELDFEKYPNAKFVSEEADKIAKSYRANHEADIAAGRTPQSCLPEGEAEVSSNDLIPHLQSYDVAQRDSVTLKQAFADLMAKAYPCG